MEHLAHESDLLAELNETLRQPLLRYLERYAGDHATAEDLLLETLIRATRGLEGFEGRATLKTWVYSIASRVAADYLRHPERRLHIIEIADVAEPCEPDEPADEQLILDEMNACVREVIESLPEDYRSALVLHEFEGMTAQQIAEVLECTVATAKIRIHRGRARLREALGRSCDFYRGNNSSLRCDRKG